MLLQKEIINNYKLISKASVDFLKKTMYTDSFVYIVKAGTLFVYIEFST